MLGSDARYREGLNALADLLHPYPWWYWTLVICGNIPVFIGLLYAVFGSRENFVACGRFLLMSDGECSGLGGFAAQLAAFFRVMLWVGLCVTAVVVQHRFLWSRLFDS